MSGRTGRVPDGGWIRRGAASVLAVAALVAVAIGCSTTAAYEGAGREHPLVGSTVAGPEACDVAAVLHADACVGVRPVRVIWRDGSSVVSDLACFSGRMNVAVSGDEVVGAFEDCSS